MTQPDLQLARAQAYLDAARPRQALDAAGQVLAAQPDSRGAAVVVARALMHLGRPDEARPVMERVLGTHPNDEQAWRLHALACARAGAWDDAWRSSRRAVSLAPQEWRTHHVAAAVDSLAKRVTDDTWAQVCEAVRLAPDEPDAHLLAGNVALHQGKLDVAERAFQEVLRLDPDRADARNNLGVVAQRRGQVLPGAISYADALRMAPDNALALRNLDNAAIRATMRLQSVLGVVMFATVRSTAGAASGTVARVSYVILAAAIVGVVAGYVWRLRARTADNLRRYLRSLPRRQPLFTASVAASTLVVPALLLGAVAPRAANAGFGVAAFAVLASLLLTTVALRRRTGATARR